MFILNSKVGKCGGTKLEITAVNVLEGNFLCLFHLESIFFVRQPQELSIYHPYDMKQIGKNLTSFIFNTEAKILLF
jgi:hypothetical protein